GYARSLVQISPHIAAAARIINVVAEYVSHLRSYCRCSVKMVTRVTLTFEPSSAKPVALKDPTMQEIMAGYDFLHDLHEHNLIPGDTKDMHGDPVPVNMVIQRPSKM
ncbi:MAG TPA: hypothetical protein VNN22_23915, partial [Verrucomicrobiae bacterium]|nr:hypothetical protein [Verrucomicrobiae bacterium]